MAKTPRLNYAGASNSGLLLAGIQDATPANTNASGYSASTMPYSITLSSAGGDQQLINVSFALNYQNTNGTSVGPKVKVDIKDGSTILHTNEFSWVVATGYNNKADFSLTAIVAKPTSSYTIYISDTQNDGGSHVITNIYLSASASKIVL